MAKEGLEQNSFYPISSNDAEFKSIRTIVESEYKSNALFKHAPVGILFSTVAGRVLLVNDSLVRMLEYDSADELIEAVNSGNRRSPLNILNADAAEVVDATLSKNAWTKYEYTLQTKTGRRCVTELHLRCRRDEQNKINILECYLEDITELKDKNDQLTQSLREKEIMLKEIHHRVKNNLQVISSLLDMEKNVAKTRELDTQYNKIKSKIFAMSLIHSHLYQSDSFEKIDFVAFIGSLCGRLEELYQRDKDIVYTVRGDVVFLSMYQAMPLALTVNEIITNSLSHAFDTKKSGEISIRLKHTIANGDEVTLTIQDNGVPLSDDIDPMTAETLGFKLVRNLVLKQLRGTLDIERRKRGTRFTIVFREA